MRDPLAGFDWLRLDERYDCLCARFDPVVGHLKVFTPTPQSDRDLYYQIVREVHASPDGRARLSIDLYEALLYWKLYSQPAAVAKASSDNKCMSFKAEAVSWARGCRTVP